MKSLTLLGINYGARTDGAVRVSIGEFEAGVARFESL